MGNEKFQVREILEDTVHDLDNSLGNLILSRYRAAQFIFLSPSPQGKPGSGVNNNGYV